MFYYRVKETIKKSGKTYREIAGGSGINLSTLVRLAQAQTSEDYNCCLLTLDALCDFLGCNPNALVIYKKK